MRPKMKPIIFAKTKRGGIRINLVELKVPPYFLYVVTWYYDSQKVTETYETFLEAISKFKEITEIYAAKQVIIKERVK